MGKKQSIKSSRRLWLRFCVVLLLLHAGCVTPVKSQLPHSAQQQHRSTLFLFFSDFFSWIQRLIFGSDPQPSVTNPPTPNPTVPGPTTPAPIGPDPTPSPSPTKQPTKQPTQQPTRQPTQQPTRQPTQPPFPPPSPPGLGAVRINCGGPEYIDSQSNVWDADKYFSGGSTFQTSDSIANTVEDTLYRTERSHQFAYEIPVPIAADYQVAIHLAEIFFSETGKRVFEITVEDSQIPNIDIVDQTGKDSAFVLNFPVEVTDGFVTITASATTNFPKISAIEVMEVVPHLAHSVPDNGGLGYAVVDTDNNGSELVSVDGSQSHTHATGEELTKWIWKEGSTVLATTEQAQLVLNTGSHDISLYVEDSAGNNALEFTVIEVLEGGFPQVDTLSPSKGGLEGGTQVTITGSGFTGVQSIKFGSKTQNGFTVVNANTITVTSPSSSVGGAQVPVSVVTNKGESNSEMFTYQGSVSIDFSVQKFLDFQSPACLEFGPDEKLYIGNNKGQIGKFTMNSDFTGVTSSVIQTVAPGHHILGLAFDPLDRDPNPCVYFSASFMFHGEDRDSFGDAINGKISMACGANLDDVTDVVTGLPISDHDHGINDIEFGNNGELYIQIGGNTNGGATLVANLGQPGYDGNLAYSKEIEGDPTSGFGPNGVEVFAPGMRNPYGIVMHTNGKLYGTDNGPNDQFGAMATGCEDGQQKPGEGKPDEFNLIEEGKWYGHANLKRGESDPRQCVWNGPDTTNQLATLNSSTNGMVEYHSNHFAGQMRGDVIVSKYGGGLSRIVLSGDGKKVDNISSLGGTGGIDVKLAPNGNLVDARYKSNNCHYWKPNDVSGFAVKTIFPRRGGSAGGSNISIYGEQFSGNPSVMVGGKTCAGAMVVNPQKIQCTVPGGAVGRVDVSVTIGSQSDTFTDGYGYIKGSP